MSLRRSLTSIGIASLAAVAAISGVAAAAHHRGAVHHKAVVGVARFVKSEAKAHTAILTIIGNDGSTNGGENFDGYANGKLTFVVPRGWNVVVNFSVSASSGIPHSLGVMPANGKFSMTSPRPVFAGAATPNAVDGTPPGDKVTMHFKVTKAGKYRLECLVPGHAQLGMWDWLVVPAKGAKATATAR